MEEGVQLSEEEILRADVQTANKEFGKYVEGLNFGTPEFLAYADGLAEISAGFEIDHLLDIAADKRIVGETIRNHENTVPGYYGSRKDFLSKYSKLYEAEASIVRNRMLADKSRPDSHNKPEWIVNDVRRELEGGMIDKLKAGRIAVLERAESSGTSQKQ